MNSLKLGKTVLQWLNHFSGLLSAVKRNVKEFVESVVIITDVDLRCLSRLRRTSKVNVITHFECLYFIQSKWCVVQILCAGIFV